MKGLVLLIIYFSISIFYCVCQWKIFKKAGRPGWHSIIPLYNKYVYLKVCNIPSYFLIFYFLPLISSEEFALFSMIIYAIFEIYTSYKLAKAFCCEIGFTLGLMFLPFIFIPILAFNSSEYILDN